MPVTETCSSVGKNKATNVTVHSMSLKNIFITTGHLAILFIICTYLWNMNNNSVAARKIENYWKPKNSWKKFTQRKVSLWYLFTNHIRITMTGIFWIKDTFISMTGICTYYNDKNIWITITFITMTRIFWITIYNYIYYNDRNILNYSGPYLQWRQKVKVAAVVGELCMEGLWKGWHFAMIGMKDIFGWGICTMIQW